MKELKEEEKPVNYIRRRKIISFVVFFLFICSAIGFWKWLNSREEDNGTLSPLRKALNANEKVNNLFFSPGHLVKEYPKSMAVKHVRSNGDIGMGDEFDASKWKLTVIRHPETPDSFFTISKKDIYSMPTKDMTVDFKCVEGWSEISNWGGVRFIDFLMKYHLGTHSGKAPDPNNPEDMYKYVGLMTPDSAYYVGIDMKSMLHPQTLLAYLMNGDTLPMDHGYPLRLIIPIKYGIKNIKRIGYIYFSDTRPKDYWFERGYDYDAAL